MYTFYFFYFYKFSISIFSFWNQSLKNTSINSIEKIFFNANWLEREVSEMFGIYFFKKIDTRVLLLEYTTSYHPMLKNFPCEGYYEIYYNLFDFNINKLPIESIEL